MGHEAGRAWNSGVLYRRKGWLPTPGQVILLSFGGTFVCVFCFFLYPTAHGTGKSITANLVVMGIMDTGTGAEMVGEKDRKGQGASDSQTDSLSSFRGYFSGLF